jgi:hypothetical protein
MPCYLFTWRAGEAEFPRALAAGGGVATRPVAFDGAMQRLLVASARAAGRLRGCRVHYVATDRAHVRVLASWSGDRPWQQVRRDLARELSHGLTTTRGRRSWFAAGRSRRRILDRRGFNRLVARDLPRHDGWKWSEKHGLHR